MNNTVEVSKISLDIQNVVSNIKLQQDNTTSASFGEIFKQIQLQTQEALDSKVEDSTENKDFQKPAKNEYDKEDTSETKKESKSSDAEEVKKSKEDNDLSEEELKKVASVKKEVKVSKLEKVKVEVEKVEVETNKTKTQTESKEKVETKTDKVTVDTDKAKLIKDKLSQIKEADSSEELDKLLQELADLLGMKLKDLLDKLMEKGVDVEKLEAALKEGRESNSELQDLLLNLQKIVKQATEITVDVKKVKTEVSKQEVDIKQQSDFDTKMETGKSENSESTEKTEVKTSDDSKTNKKAQAKLESDLINTKLKEFVPVNKRTAKAEKLFKERVGNLKGEQMQQQSDKTEADKQLVEMSKNSSDNNAQAKTATTSAHLNLSNSGIKISGMQLTREVLNIKEVKTESLAKEQQGTDVKNTLKVQNASNSSSGTQNSNQNFNLSDFSSQNQSQTNNSQKAAKQSFVPKQPVNTNKAFTNIVKETKLMLSQGKSEMTIQLKPEFLGKLKINVIMENGTMTAKFIADNPEVKQLIEQNLDQLKQSFMSQNLNVGGFSVEVKQEQTNNFNKEFKDKSSKFINRTSGMATQEVADESIVNANQPQVDRDYSTISYVA